jgi:hypothetical protein
MSQALLYLLITAPSSLTPLWIHSYTIISIQLFILSNKSGIIIKINMLSIKEVFKKNSKMMATETTEDTEGK